MQHTAHLHHAGALFRHCRQQALRERARRSSSVKLIESFVRSREAALAVSPALAIQQAAQHLAEKMTVFADEPRGDEVTWSPENINGAWGQQS